MIVVNCMCPERLWLHKSVKHACMPYIHLVQSHCSSSMTWSCPFFQVTAKSIPPHVYFPKSGCGQSRHVTSFKSGDAQTAQQMMQDQQYNERQAVVQVSSGRKQETNNLSLCGLTNQCFGDFFSCHNLNSVDRISTILFVSLKRDLSNGAIKVHIWALKLFANLAIPWIIAHAPRPKNDKL